MKNDNLLQIIQLLLKKLLFGGQYKVHVQINVYTNVPHTVHVLFILYKISKDILRTCLRTFEADIPKIFKNVQPQSKIRGSYKKKCSTFSLRFLSQLFDF